MKTVTGHRSDNVLQEYIDNTNNTDTLKFKSAKILQVNNANDDDSVMMQPANKKMKADDSNLSIYRFVKIYLTDSKTFHYYTNINIYCY
jgi:hypothetical protein